VLNGAILASLVYFVWEWRKGPQRLDEETSDLPRR
jgi:hypothetical protein